MSRPRQYRSPPWVCETGANRAGAYRMQQAHGSCLTSEPAPILESEQFFGEVVRVAIEAPLTVGVGDG
ncbi:MAG: hypothetical protein V3W33_03360 [Gammaproteobacteria bacterium]